MDLDTIYRYIGFRTEKELGQWYAPERLDDEVHLASLDAFNHYYTVERKTQFVQTALRPFRKVFDFAPTDFINGFLNTPVGYRYATSMSIADYDNQTGAFIKQVDIYKEDEWAYAVNSQVNRPTAYSPKAMESLDGKVEIVPAQGYSGKLRYLSLPAKPLYAYTYVSGVLTYNQGGSTQLQWADEHINEIVYRALKALGVNLGSKELIDIADRTTVMEQP